MNSSNRITVSVVAMVLSYLVPAIVALVVSGEPAVLVSLLVMVANVWLFSYVKSFQKIDDLALAQSTLLILLVGIVEIVAVVVSKNPVMMLISLVMFFVSVFGYLLLRE